MKQGSGRIGRPPRPERIIRALTPFREFTHTEAAGGVFLLLATVIALTWANSPWGDSYFQLWETELGFDLNGIGLSKTLLHWINDGLMVIFFLVVGLEIKREVLVGELSALRQAVLPIAAAIGGAITPAAIFIMLNTGGESAAGWGIPMATDIAFALGILALLGSRVPVSLKIFLTALAIIDDLMAVMVIALFYTGSIEPNYLLLATGFLAVAITANWLHINRPIVYGVIGIGLWLAFLQSGVHATVAGVLLAMTIPARTKIDTEEFLRRGRTSLDEFRTAGDLGTSILTNTEHHAALQDLQNITELAESPMQRLEHSLHPWVSFAIIPTFAFANAGVLIGEQFSMTVTSTLGIGIILGLVLGKQIGITLFSWLAVRLGLTQLPDGVGFRHIYGIGWLAGIGFTMSLFITDLAFDNDELLATAKVAVLSASLICGIVGWLFLRWTLDQPRSRQATRASSGETAHVEAPEARIPVHHS